MVASLINKIRGHKIFTMKNWGDYPCSIFEIVSSHGASVVQRNAESLIYMFSAVWAKGGWTGKVTQESSQNRQEYRRNTNTWGLRPSFSISSFTAEQVDFCSQCNTPKTFPHVSQSTERWQMESNISNFESSRKMILIFNNIQKERRHHMTQQTLRLNDTTLSNDITERTDRVSTPILHMEVPLSKTSQKRCWSCIIFQAIRQWWLNAGECRLGM